MLMQEQIQEVKSVMKRAREMFERMFLKEQLKKKEYLKKQQQENKEKSHSNKDSTQPNIPECHKHRRRSRRQKSVGTVANHDN